MNNTAEVARLPLLFNEQPHPDGVMLWFSITLKWLVMHTNQHKDEQLYGPTGLAGSLPARHSLLQFTAGAPCQESGKHSDKYGKYVRCISSMSS